MEKIFKIFRIHYTAQTTSGDFYSPEDYKNRFCVTLEDTARPIGIKVKGETCLAPGTYRLSTSVSSRFKREMPIIFTEVDKSTAIMGGISFGGARLHGGNDHTHTHGCPLVAYNRISWDKIQGTAEKAITKLIKDYEADGHKCYLQILNENQAG